MIHWNVYVENINGKRIEKCDIFSHGNHIKEIAKLLKKHVDDKLAFADGLRTEMMYHYWSRCEWEIILTSWPPSKDGTFEGEKIDVFDQLSMNWDVFVDYIWDHRKEVIRESRKKS